ncbi:hypothetical protein pb186bvf_007930 [Paramecium bursaria]
MKSYDYNNILFQQSPYYDTFIYQLIEQQLIMEFHYGRRYAFYTLGKDIQVNMEILNNKNQLIQPFLILEQQGCVIYEYDPYQSIRMDELILSLQYISLSIKQILTILQQIWIEYEKIYEDKFSLLNLSLCNVMIIPQRTKINYREPSSKLQIQLIGLQYQKPEIIDQAKRRDLIKNLFKLIIRYYEQKYLEREQFQQLSYGWLQFKSQLYESDDYGDFLKKYVKLNQSDKNLEQFLYESNSHKTKGSTFQSFVNQNEAEFSKLLNGYPDKLSLLIISNIQNHLFVCLQESIKQYQATAGYFSGSFSVNQTINNTKIRLEQIKQLLKTDEKILMNMFLSVYNQSLCLKDHFSKYIFLDQNWFQSLKHKSLMQDYLFLAAKSEKLNNFKNLTTILEYIDSQQNQTQPQQNNKKSCINMMKVENFDYYFQDKINEYLIGQINRKFDIFD